MMECIEVLVTLTRFSIEAVSVVDPALSMVLMQPCLLASVFPILFPKQIDMFAQSNQLFAVFMDHMPGYAWIKDAEGRYVYANERVNSLTPFQNECVGKTDADLWPSELAGFYRDRDRTVFKSGKSIQSVDSFVVNHEEHWALVSRFPIFDESGAVILVGAAGVDITEHKQAEEALRESEHFRRMIVESEPECVKLVATDGTLLDMNPAGLAMIEATSLDQVIGKSVLKLIAPAWQSTFLSMHERVCQGEAVVSEFEIVGLKGSHRWMESHAVPLRDKESKVIAQLAIARDVTERRLAESALTDSRRYLQAIFVNSLDGIFVTNDEGRYIDANPAACTMLGYSRDELLQFKVSDLTAESSYEVGMASWRQFLEMGTLSGEFGLRHKDGSEIEIEFRAVANILPGVHVASGRNITERRRAADGLREAEQRYRDIFENANEGIFQSTPDGRFLVVNPALAHMLGYESPEELMQSLTDISTQIYVDSKRRDEFGGLLAEHGMVREFEHQVFRKDGSKIWISVNARAVNDAQGQLLYYEGTTQDVTSRKLAELALRKSEERYRKLAENFPNGSVITYDRDLRVTFISGQGLQQAGLSADFFVGTTLQEIAPEEVVALVKPHFLAAFEGQTESYECPYPDGRTFVAAVAPLLDADGLINEILVVSQDITEHKDAEADLRKQKEILQKIFDHLPVMISFTDSDGRIQLVNREWQRTLGWSQEEILSENLDVFVVCYPDPQDQPEARKLVKAATGEWVDFKARTRDGSTIDSTWARVKLSDGTTIGIGKDISARKRADQALQQAEQRYRELFENSKDATYVHDLNGKYTSLNRAAEKLSGYSRTEIIGRSFSDFVAPEYVEHMRENMCRKLRQEGETTYEVEAITKDGRRVPVEISSCLIYDDGVPVAVQGTARNTEDRHRAEEALRGYSRQLIKAQEEERQSIARELHDQIGQVLTAIRINLETVRVSANLDENNALVNEGMAMIDQVLQQVRELSFTLRPSLLDDLGLAAALRWYVDRFAQRTGIQAKTSIWPGSPMRFPRELETACFRIVQEALTNVARHAEAKNVSVEVSTIHGDVTLLIKDDGVGFDPQPRTKNAALKNLGLRGMEERAHVLGGKLEIKSASHNGTEIRVHFPDGNKERN